MKNKVEGFFKCFVCGIENVFYKKDFLNAWDGKSFICSFCKAERMQEQEIELKQGKLFKNE